MRGRRHRILFFALLAVPIAFACGEEVSIPDEVPDATSPADGGRDTTAPDTGSNDAGADAADVTCPLVTPDDGGSVYVSTTGVDGNTCGTRAAPCKTIAFGLGRATAGTKKQVNVARGIYPEHLTLVKGVEIIGGWEATGTTWKRSCTSPEDAVVIRAPAKSVTVTAQDLGGEAKLTLLRIESKPQGLVESGESIYGLVALGATTTVTLSDVRIDLANGGIGKIGVRGDAGAAAPATCVASTGDAGARGAQGPGAPSGVFDPAGYTPGLAAEGGAGSVAENGTPGGPGACVRCGTCLVAGCVFIADPTDSCGKEGVNGCAGGPGGPGGPATGGGSSVGVYAWDATVKIIAGGIRSGDGGNGGVGGVGGDAGASSVGVGGTPADVCTIGCTLVGGAVCTDIKGRGTGGDAGGAGGPSGPGGSGGGGGGGSSFSIYQGGTGNVTTTATTKLDFGKAGVGGPPDGGAGATGAAAKRFP